MATRTPFFCAVTLALLASAEGRALGHDAPPAPEKPSPSLFYPPLTRGMTRVQGTLRPFINMLNPGVGLLADMSVEHYLQSPFKIGVEISPLALVSTQEGLGAIAHIRARGAFSTDGLEVGLGVGARYQHFGPSGMSFSPNLRVGALDGFNMRLELSHSLIRNYYTGLVQFVWANTHLAIDIPVNRKLALTLDGGWGNDLWFFGNFGARHFITGNGGPGTLIIGASFGMIYLVDRFKCQYTDVDPCRGNPTALGPTIGVRVDRRF